MKYGKYMSNRSKLLLYIYNRCIAFTNIVNFGDKNF